MVRWAFLFPICVGLSGCALGFFSATSSDFKAAPPEALQARLLDEGSQPNGQVDHFAILLGANTELRHRGNLSLAYQVLLEQGYTREHIYILDSEGQTPFFPVTDFTTLEAIRGLFAHLARVIEPQDTLFVYVTGHGRRVTADEEENGSSREIGVSTLVLNPGEELSQDEFALLLSGLRPEVGIIFFDQCYWGSLSGLSACNYITITTSEDDRTSHGVSFPRAFWRSFRNTPLGQGPPTLLDAFKRAMVDDPATRRGHNKPRISYGCVNPNKILLLGNLKQARPDVAKETSASVEEPVRAEEAPAPEPDASVGQAL